MEAQQGREWLTVPEVAELLQVDPETVRRWVRRGELAVLNLGRKSGYRVKREDLGAFIAGRYGRQGKAAA